ncbi:unnamed protein product [Meganyctiphanes norvegica]|uniref:Uncharacterized protein n=1 Tax=Meganyctiphanes norvegica TaxID=48144 RepID=A0AAV2PNR6_MEGNR
MEFALLTSLKTLEVFTQRQCRVDVFTQRQCRVDVFTQRPHKGISNFTKGLMTLHNVSDVAAGRWTANLMLPCVMSIKFCERLLLQLWLPLNAGSVLIRQSCRLTRSARKEP